MQIIKPLQLSTLHRTFTFREKHLFSVGVLEGFRLDSGESVMELDFWPAVIKALPMGQVVDTAMPKDRAEFLVLGRFFSPGGRKVTAGKVVATLGAIRKELYVFGDRRWRNLGGERWTITDPPTINEMPIEYARAFGGSGLDTNPEGKGAAPIPDEFGGVIDPLPNIESPKNLITAPDARPFPAGFSNIPVMWPHRLKKAGTYDDEWQKKRAPGLPDDIDWCYFNEAPPDQWFDGFLKGDEHFCLEYMHPQLAKIEGQLPAHIARCFVRRKKDESVVVEEINTHVDTVLFIPHENLGLVIHRGTVEVANDQARDIDVLMLAYEKRADARRSFAHYEQELFKRHDPKQSYKYALYTVPLIPLNARCGFSEMQQNADFPLEMKVQQNLMAQGDLIREQAKEKFDKGLEEQQQLLNEQLKAAGQPPVDLRALSEKVPETDPALAKILAMIDEAMPMLPGKPGQVDITRLDLEKLDAAHVMLQQYSEDQQQKMRYNAKARIEEALQSIEENHGQHMDDHARAEVASMRKAIDVFDKPAPLPRPPSLNSLDEFRKQIIETEAQISHLRAKGYAEQDLPKIDFDIDALEAQIKETGPKVKAAYMLGAHNMPWGAPPHAGSEKDVRSQLLDDWHAGKDLRGRDLAGLDLSGLDLTGIDLGECFLEDVNFERAILNNAKLDSSIVVRARMSKAALVSADLQAANMGASDLTETNISQANARRTRFSKAKLYATNFSHSQLGDLQEQFMTCFLKGVNFSHALMDQPLFIELSMPECNFTGVVVNNPGIFMNCKMAGVPFDGMQGHRLVWTDCDLSDASFKQVKFDTLCFAGATNLSRLDARGADIVMGNMRQMQLQSANFAGASVIDCDFSEADLQNANFRGANLTRSQFMQTLLNNADCRGANLMEGSLYKAFLIGTDFRSANLYSVSFIQATLGNTQFNGANLDQTILKDWRP